MARTATWRLQRQNRKGCTYFALTKGSRGDTVSLGLGTLTEDEAAKALATMRGFELEARDGYIRDLWDKPASDQGVNAAWGANDPGAEHATDEDAWSGRGGKAEPLTGRERAIKILLSSAGLTDEPDHKRMTVKTYYAAIYAPWKKTTKPKSWPAEESEWRRLLASPIGGLRVSEVNAHDLDEYLETLRKLDGRPATWNMKRKQKQALTSMLTYALRKRHRVAPLPTWFKLEGSLVRTHAKPVPLTPDEVEALIAAGAGRGEREVMKVRALLAVAFSEGLRPFEVTSIMWSDVLWDRPHASGVGVLHVAGTKTQGSDAEVPLFPVALRELREWWLYEGKPTTGLTFPSSRGGAYARTGWKQVLETAAKRAGMEGRRIFPYLGRHSAGTNLVAEGVPMQTVAKILRHTNPRMLERHYDHTGALRAPGLGVMFPAPVAAPAKASAPVVSKPEVATEITEDHWLHLLG